MRKSRATSTDTKKTIKPMIMVGDFETTVYEGQESTEVWASGLCELGTEDAVILHSIDDTFEYLVGLQTNVIVYYHNLKFDGSFWLYFLATKTDYELAMHFGAFDQIQDMQKGTYEYLISDMGAWYTITIRTRYGKYIYIRDSLKLLPFSVKQIGKSFKTKHRKLDMEYEGYRFAGCEITDQEKEYLKNDLYVVKEALEIMFAQGHNKLTIGACCYTEFKELTGKFEFDTICPDLSKEECPFEGFASADAWIRKSYRGGWCYLVKGKENKIFEHGITLDVNSLYPSMMHTQSGNPYPTGKPNWFFGPVPEDVLNNPKQKYFFICVKTKFRIKKGKLPTIQIKGNIAYRATEWLETSDVKDPNSGIYYDHYYVKGVRYDTTQTLYLTCTDYKLLHDQYDLWDYEEVGGCWFWTLDAIFDQYINKYKKIKMESTGAVRTLAKLFLNNLYGKLASSNVSSFKVFHMGDDKVLKYSVVEDYSKKVGYIPMGSAITSYARNFTIRCAQANFHGKDQPGFIYADTDSIHCDIPVEEIKNAPLHPTEFCHWKHETSWDKAIFVRQKTYIEHVVEEDDKPLENPYYNIKCAGMPERCKKLLAQSMGEDHGMKPDTEEEALFLEDHRALTDFKSGLIVPGKLLPKQVPGGVILTRTTFEMR